MSLVQLEIDSHGVAVLTLNDEARLNAMSEAMAAEFSKHLSYLEDHPPRVIILTGAGRSFSAGGDLDMLESKTQKSAALNQEEMLRFYCSFLDILDLDVPVIACVRGHAVGAGFCLVCACDVRVMEEDAVFAAPFLRMGLFPGMGATYFPQRALGTLGLEMLLTGKRIDASEAERRGFGEKVACGQGMVRAREVATAMLHSAPHVTTDLLKAVRPSRIDRLAYLEREARLQGQSYLHEEFAQGLAAARAKRPSPFGPQPS